MKRSWPRLIIAAVLFVGWMSWLVYLAATGTDAVVLSRPQFLVANVHLIAEVESKNGLPAAEVTVRKVSWAVGLKNEIPEESKITIENLPELKDRHGWEGPGEYILALVSSTAGKDVIFKVAATPRSPGFPYGQGSANQPGPPRIYASTPARQRQLEQIEAAFKREFNAP
jgi:hypothetical protein